MEPRGEGKGRSGSRRRAGPDVWVVVAWWVVVAVLGFSRTDYTGDGLRHLPSIVEGLGPRLGEPRWLLFPGFLYGLLRPFVVLGLATDVGALAHVMMGATVVAGGVYMLALRACLVATGVDARHRAAALALAGASAGLLLPSADLMEPIFGATLAVCGLAWAARRAGAPAAEDRRRALLVAVASIVVAALLYQGLVLALGLVPLVVSRETLRDRRAQILSLLILAVVPLAMVGALVLAGDSVAHALGRALQGEENHFYSSYMKKSGVMARVVPVLAGPPQGLVSLTDFHGFNGLIASLRGGAGRREALETLAELAFGAAIVWLGVLGAARRRDVAVLLAFASLLILPVVRCQQYGYLKFYILFAVVVAFAAARERPAFVAAAALGLVALNLTPMFLYLPASLRDSRERAAVYAEAGRDSCWFTTAWIPSYSFRWPGRVCAVLGSLAGGHGATDAAVLAMGHGALTSCLDACFCGSSSVLTDDMTEAGGPLVAASAAQFRYTERDLGELVLPAARAERLSPAGAATPVFRYPASEQRRLCERLTHASKSVP
jgi:hypothetical protein